MAWEHSSHARCPRNRRFKSAQPHHRFEPYWVQIPRSQSSRLWREEWKEGNLAARAMPRNCRDANITQEVSHRRLCVRRTVTTVRLVYQSLKGVTTLKMKGVTTLKIRLVSLAHQIMSWESRMITSRASACVLGSSTGPTRHPSSSCIPGRSGERSPRA